MILPVYLIGARGCGKTTAGKALAEALSYSFCDTDEYLQQAAQRTVTEIVTDEGWKGFRQRESQALIAVSKPGTVVATGGGIVLEECNRHFMRERGRVIYLHAGADILSARLEAQPLTEQRPTLTGRPISEEIFEVLDARSAVYKQVAHYTIDAVCTPDVVVQQMLKALALFRAS